MHTVYPVVLATQILAGVLEERGIERLLHGNAVACGAASFIVRTANTFVGAPLGQKPPAATKAPD